MTLSQNRKHPYNPWYDWIAIGIISPMLWYFFGVGHALTISLLLMTNIYLYKWSYRFRIIVAEIKADVNQKTEIINTLYTNQKLLFELVNTLRLRVTRLNETKKINQNRVAAEKRVRSHPTHSRK